ncbi:MAG: hypothetical protein GY761_12270, partial [Hyphomicrobiales bacterium]|nr:hypothetical protein [Hyphomicrobiales bacterium]
LGDKRSLAVTRGKIADILVARGDIDEAYRIRTEEQLPVYEALGDKRSLAVTRGKIAGILEARGDIDEALSVWAEVAVDAESLGDRYLVMASKQRTASIHIAKGIDNEETAKAVFEGLGDAYRMATEMNHAVAVAGIGWEFGRFLAATSLKDEAVRVLQSTVAAMAKLGHGDTVDRVEQMIAGLLEENKQMSQIIGMASGPNQAAIEAELTAFLQHQFGEAPTREETQVSAVTKDVDPVAVAVLILNVPMAIVATIDLAERAKLAERVARLISAIKAVGPDTGDIATLKIANGGELDLTVVTTDEVVAAIGSIADQTD